MEKAKKVTEKKRGKRTNDVNETEEETKRRAFAIYSWLDDGFYFIFLLHFSIWRQKLEHEANEMSFRMAQIEH